MATDPIPPFLRSPAPVGGVELSPMYLTHWQIFLVRHGMERWWQWCPARLTGGIDVENIRWSTPRGDFLPRDEQPNPDAPQEGRNSQQKAWLFSEEPIDSFDLPYLAPEP